MTRRLAMLTISFLLLPSGLQADLLVDHVEYMRSAGTAQETSIFFPACDPAGAYTLTVQNGQDDAHRATTGAVTLNGVEIVSPADFTPAPAVITRTIGNVGEHNTLAVSATAPQGSVIGWQVTAQVTCPDITITSPVAGEVFNRGEITVWGRVRHRTPEVGIRVNGVLAHVNGNVWAADGVPLAVGGNTISAMMVDENGVSSTTSVIVSRVNSAAGGVDLKAYNASGLVPLVVPLAATNATGKAIVRYEVEYGDGAAATLTAFDEVRHTYDAEGLYRVAVRGVDSDGVEYLDDAAVNVHPLPPLRTRWEKMKAGVVMGDTGAALANFTTQEARAQEQIFQALGSQAATMIEQMQDIGRVYLEGDRAQYRIRRNELVDGIEKPITYYIEFIRDADGFWKIDSF